MLPAKSQGSPARILVSAEAVTRRRSRRGTPTLWAATQGGSDFSFAILHPGLRIHSDPGKLPGLPEDSRSSTVPGVLRPFSQSSSLPGTEFVRPSLMVVFLNPSVATGLQIGEQVENLLFGKRVEQAQRHHGRRLWLSSLDVGLLESLDERVGRAGLDGQVPDIFFDDHAEHLVSIFQLEPVIPVTVSNEQRRFKDLPQHVRAVVVIPFDN